MYVLLLLLFLEASTLTEKKSAVKEGIALYITKLNKIQLDSKKG